MNLTQLRYFLATIEHGSFSAAARELLLAQPSLSEQVRRLEGELGVDLFHRVGRRLVPTEAGNALRPHAERVLAAVIEARSAVVEVRELRGGLVEFGTFGTSSHYLLEGLVRDFRRRHAGVRLRIVGRNSAEVADDVRGGRLESGFVVLPIDDEGLDVRPVMRDEVLFASATPGAVATPISIEALAERPLILSDAGFGTSDPTRRQLYERAQAAGVRIDPAIDVEELDVALDLAARGFGDTVVARGVTLGRHFPRALRTVGFVPPMFDTFAFITRRGATLSPGTRALLAVAAARVETVVRRIEGGTAPVKAPGAR